MAVAKEAQVRIEASLAFDLGEFDDSPFQFKEQALAHMQRKKVED
ncbi:hypothetical protein [Pseudomonas aeruginosa]|nr:hypothetical protein [Pseudomonas aeruginosa]